MLSIIKNKEKDKSRWNLFNRSNGQTNPRPILEKFVKSFGKELKLRLRQIDSSSDSLPVAEAVHLATDNLTNVKLTIEKTLRFSNMLTEELVLDVLDEQSEKTTAVLRSEMVSGSSQATEIGVRTLNLLFRAKQQIKQKFSLVTPLILPEDVGSNGGVKDQTNPKLLPSVNDAVETPRMIISSTLLYQLHHSLFPAERMLVAAGKRNGTDIEIDGIFDVTGNASSGFVRADANRLARALIVMSETDKHFALWIHSHPGLGKGATSPSNIDLNQEAEWLKDYSANLVNAILVEDGYVRFWGKALKEKRVTVAVTGTGIVRESEDELIFRLEC